MNIIDIYRAFHSTTLDYTFFPSKQETFLRIDYMIGHKTSLNIFRKFKTIPSIFSDHSTLKLESNCNKEMGNTTNMQRLNNEPLKNNFVKERIKGKIKIYTETNENDNIIYQNVGMQEKQ